MRRPLVLCPLGLLLVAPAALAAPAAPVHHDLKVVLEPARKSISVEDTITLRQESRGGLRFVLHAGMSPSSATRGVEVAPVQGAAPALDRAGDEQSSAPLETFQVKLPRGVRTFTVRYQGVVDHPIAGGGEDYARSFSETSGLVSAEGAYLAESTAWYPIFAGQMVTFALEARLPAGWEAISQGARTRHSRDGAGTEVRWQVRAPQQEIDLVAGPLTEYRRAGTRVEALVFLRTPDEELARTYLDATLQYLEMYSALLGPYPYETFSLVENFWETGYGMPSFTLLGSKIIRFPFILTSSYPHEILHNWWGNSVYVDYATGNWCEGLTAYLADHLIQEQRGAGAEYRQDVLQKYTDYVSRGRDFALTEFRSRHSAATEAVGYGKTLELFHMLRLELGDETFVRGLRELYRARRFRVTSFADVERAFEKASRRKLAGQFDQWVKRPGAPRLRLSAVAARPAGRETVLTAVIEQIQGGTPYRLRVPVAVTLEGQERAYQSTVVMDGPRLDLSLTVPGRPLRLDVDPEYDLFRGLDPSERAPALSGVFGAERATIVLPSAAPAPLLAAYRDLAKSWSDGKTGAIEVKLDRELTSLPADRAVWIFGWENRFVAAAAGALKGYDAALDGKAVRIGRTTLPRTDHSAALAVRHPANPALTVGWLAADTADVVPGLGRKLPHYHKYSYVGFEGKEPTNVVKGRWPVVGSPMTAFVGGATGVEMARLAPRKALAELPEVFSRKSLAATIRFLSGARLGGRGFGTPGLDRAAEAIARDMKAAGLAPGGDDGTYFQSWTERGGEPERETRLRNVVGILPGRNREWADQSVLVVAHYDHLGRGWPANRSEDRGKIHPGADDNASGVAVLLELARVVGRGFTPDRTVVFVAFTGEEAGLRGSRHYVAEAKRFPARKAIGVLNLDTVGRLGRNKLLVLGAGSAREWIHIFMGAGATTGVPVESVMADPGSSDQASIQAVGVPAVQLFTGPHLDYHRPTDTADKVDVDGLVKVAAVAREAIEYLAVRPEPLTASGSGAATGSPTTGPPGARKVSLGTVPEFGYDGEGVKLSGVAPGSPAEKAGLRAGDVIVRLGSTPVHSLRELSEALKTLQPGDRVAVTVRRDGKELTVEARVEAR